MRRWPALLFAGALLFASNPALGNGRFPQSQRVLEDPTDPRRLYVASTFGLLITSDRGATWHYSCEQHFAKENAEGDPLLELTTDGRMLSGIGAMLNRSSACGCNWDTVAAADEDELVADITQDDSGSVLLLSYRLVSGSYVFRVSSSADAGTSWTLLSELSGLSFATTIDVAPSNRDRLYVAGYDASGQGQLAISDNRGGSWRLVPIALASVDSQPYLAAVHPTDPDTVFVRTQAVTTDGTQQDTLLWSRDSGSSWGPLIQQAASIYGFALAPDGTQLMVGYGDRVAPGLFVDAGALGIYRAQLTDQPLFDKVFEGAVSCLRWTPSGLYACLSENHPEVPSAFGLGFAADPGFDLTTPEPFEQLLHYADVLGPPSCAAGTCAEAWLTTCQALGASCATPPGELMCPETAADAGTAGDAAVPTTDAGTSDAAPDSEPPSAGGGSADDGGCACSVRRESAAPETWGLIVAALAACRSLRRRRRTHLALNQGATPAGLALSRKVSVPVTSTIGSGRDPVASSCT